MPKNRQIGKLAFILHADIAGSTELVHQDEHIAHERIQDTFRRFSDTINRYHGRVCELRGDALLAEFERPSDAVTAALVFQQDQSIVLENLNDDVIPTVRVGIAMGEVIFADNTVTGAGVILAQRVEQLASPGSVCVTAAIYEGLPKRFPFDYENLGEHPAKGFDEPVRVYVVRLRTGQAVPQPEVSPRPESSPKIRKLILGAAALTLIVIAGVVYKFRAQETEETMVSKPSPSEMGQSQAEQRGFTRTGVKLGKINLRLKVPTRWDIETIEETDLKLQGFETDWEEIPGWDFARQLDGTINSQVLVAVDKQNVAHFRVFKIYKFVKSGTVEDAHLWLQDRGVQLVLDRLIGNTDYREINRHLEMGTLGSGEEMTLMSFELENNHKKQYVWMTYVIRGDRNEQIRDSIVFLFHNGDETREIEKSLVLEITNYADKLFN